MQNRYLGNQYHMEEFKTADGKLLLDGRDSLDVRPVRALPRR